MSQLGPNPEKAPDPTGRDAPHSCSLPMMPTGRHKGLAAGGAEAQVAPAAPHSFTISAPDPQGALFGTHACPQPLKPTCGHEDLAAGGAEAQVAAHGPGGLRGVGLVVRLRVAG